MSGAEAEAVTIQCPCGYERTVTEPRYHPDTPVLESAKKRAAGHSGQCEHDYEEVTFDD